MSKPRYLPRNINDILTFILSASGRIFVVQNIRGAELVVASAYQLIVRKVDVVASWATDETSGTKILEVSDETDLAVRGQRLKK